VTTNTSTTVVNQTTANGGFSFETNVTVPVTVHIVTGSGPVANAPVTVSESQSNGELNILGQGTTDSQGTAVIPISVPPTVTQVNVSVIGVNPTTGEVQELTGTAPVQVASGTGATSSGTVSVAPTINLTATNFQPTSGCATAIDTDCDGVVNQYDEFPTDPTLASTARSGRYTIAFEDLFPSAGDADLNDHTTVFSTELDKTPTNKVKTIRGTFTHVGKGAGYNHELRLKLDVPVGAKFEVSYLDGSGNPWSGCASATKYVAGASGDCTGGNLSAAALKTGILVLPSSDKTLFGKQNSPAPGATFTAKDFVRGVTANVTITFDQPVDLNTTVNTVGGHLNWFLAFNQKTNNIYRQIFRPGYVFDGAGKDVYIDSKGFPWAIIVPGVFNHPTAGSDIRKASSTGYAYFNTWAESKGVEHKDWYTQITNPVYVVRVKDFYTENGFSAYLLKAVRKNIFEVSASLIVIGAAMGFLMKKRLSPKVA
jgi:LruC domain-containing protein